MIRFFISTLVLLGFYANAADVANTGSVPLHPNPDYTTGDFCKPKDPDFQEYRYKERVPTCYRDVSWGRKARVYGEYKIPQKCWKYYTVDHYIPLFMGGSNQEINLWPEHKDVKATRQNLEQELYDQMRAGTITQKRAIEVITHAKLHPPHVVPKACR